MGGCVGVAVGDWIGVVTATTTAPGAFVGMGVGAFRAALAGAVGSGRGVSVGAGGGPLAGSSPQATASMMITANAKASGFMQRSSFSCARWKAASISPSFSLVGLALWRVSLPRTMVKCTLRARPRRAAAFCPTGRISQRKVRSRACPRSGNCR